MPTPASISHTARSQYGPYGVFVLDHATGDPRDSRASRELIAGERVGGPVVRRKRSVLRILVVLVLGSAAAAAASRYTAEIADFASTMQRLLQAPNELNGPIAASTESQKSHEPAAPITDERTIAAPVQSEPVAATPAQVPRETVEEASLDAPMQPPAPQRLPEVRADPGNPLQQKALAAGLHPSLSRALLERLSDEDFRHATEAIRQALARGPDGEAGYWPKRTEKGNARFRVKLIEGAPSACKRYVVQIAKSGWETTARPMERCRDRANPT